MKKNATMGAVDMSPAVRRVVTSRLLTWLPHKPVRLICGAELLGAELLKAGVHLTRDSGFDAAVAAFEDDGSAQDVRPRLAEVLHTISVPICVIVVGHATDHRRRALWEGAFMEAGWRKHPLIERIAPYGEIDRVSGVLMLAFEPVPPAARERYPLEVLKAERDLHTDMTREPGRRSDAHLARYTLAAEFIRKGDRVIDVASGLGYGSYMLSEISAASSVIGLDSSQFAIEYASANFCAPHLHFEVGDAEALTQLSDSSVDFAVSVETLEHLRDPDRLLAELRRVLVPGGKLYVSVPNDWSDESGKDPNPFHFHVYCWDILKSQLQRNEFEIERAWLQDAGGGQKRSLSPRSMLEVDPLAGATCDGEWLLVLARRLPKQETTLEHTGLDQVAAALSLLAAGERGSSLSVLGQLARDRSDHVRAAAATALLAILHARAGETTSARAQWQACVGLAEESLEDDPSRAASSALLALALAALEDSSTRIDELLQAHKGAAALLSLDSFVISGADLNDRAFWAGADDHVNLTAAEVRQTIDAKDWLDAKYREHLSQIESLQDEIVELEQARHWLDGQYHELVELVKKLRQRGAE